MLPGGNDEVFQETIIIEAAQANQALAEFRTQVNQAKQAIMDLQQVASQAFPGGLGEAKIDFAGSLGFTPQVLEQAQAELASTDAAVQKLGIDTTRTMEQDVIEIKRATAALQEMASAQRTTPMSASTSPQYQDLGFQPATTTAALTNMGAAFDKTAGKKDSFRLNLSQLYAKFKEGTLTVNDFSSVLMGAFGAAVGFMVVSVIFQIVGALGNMITGLNQAAEASLKFLDAQFKLEIGLRDAQRQGFQVSRTELNKYIADLNAAYPMLSTIVITQGIADSIFILKNFGLTSDQAFKTFNASAALAVATGKDMGTVTREIALAASSGYSVALQKMGLDINKATVAEEAHRAGVDLSYTALSREQKVLYTLNLVAEQTSGIIGDLVVKQNTLAGQAEATSAKMEQAQTLLGKSWEPVKLAWDKFAAQFVATLAWILDGLNKFGAYIDRDMAMIRAELADPAIMFDKAKWDKAFADAEASAMRLHGLATAFSEDALPANQNALAEALGLDPDQLQTVLDDTDKFAANVLQIVQDYQKSLADATQKYNDDVAKIDSDGEKKRLDLKKKFQQDMASIDTKLSDDLAKAQTDYARNEASANAKANEDALNALIDEKRKEEDIQQKYVESVKKLNDKLTMDLEEAVRAGDVIQIRKLKRQYPSDLADLGTTRDQDLASARKDLQNKLSDAERQRAFDKQQRAIDYQQKIADLNAQAALQRQQTQEQYVQSLADLNQSLANERKARTDSYNQQWRDLYQSYQDKLKTASEALADEVQMNQQAMDAIIKMLVETYGAGGIFQQVYDDMQNYVASGGKTGLWKGLMPPTAPPTTGTSSVTGASSGLVSSNNSPSSVQVSVDLGPDLQGKIVNSSLNAMADILVRNG